MDNKIDSLKKYNLKLINKNILSILLQDHTTNKNIIWATDDYSCYDEGYNQTSEITLTNIQYGGELIILPRHVKSQQEQQGRTRGKAEVFTPSWVCNLQNNLVDSAWFGREGVFNTENDKRWTTNHEKILFEASGDKTWGKYVNGNRMEITCGEAPYLVSPYDAVTGDEIDIQNRIGLLDRKLRIVNENTTEYEDWFLWTKTAFQSIYGFELQGDNLLLARSNLLFTFIDNFYYKFNRDPTNDEQRQIAEIISWNIWQMDGLKFAVPFSEDIVEYEDLQLSMFEPIKEEKPEPKFCLIKDWKEKSARKSLIEFRTLIKDKEKK